MAANDAPAKGPRSPAKLDSTDTIRDLARCIMNLESRIEGFNEGQTMMKRLLLEMQASYVQVPGGQDTADLDKLTTQSTTLPEALTINDIGLCLNVRPSPKLDGLKSFQESLLAEMQRHHASMKLMVLDSLASLEKEFCKHYTLNPTDVDATNGNANLMAGWVTSSPLPNPPGSEETAKGAAQDFFDQVDTDHDGVMSKAELDQAFKTGLVGKESICNISPGNGTPTEGEIVEAKPAKSLEELVKEEMGEEGDYQQISAVKDVNDSMGGLFGLDGDEIDTPQYFVEDYYFKTGCCQAVAASNWFQNTSVAVVLMNAAYMGLAADLNTADNLYNAHLVWIIFSNFFGAFFLAELLIRFMAFRETRYAFRDGWFKFDAILVVTMVLDLWCLEIYSKVNAGGGVKIPVQPIRLLRLLKLCRMARLMQAFPELITMIKGVIRALRAVASSMMLIMLMMYCWGIVLHMLLKEEQELNEHISSTVMWWNVDFSTFVNCVFALFTNGTLMLDNTAPLIATLCYNNKFNVKVAGFCFILFVFISALLILQMLIGVLTDVVSQVSQERKDTRAIALVKQRLLSSLQECDDGDGSITQDELLKVMANPHSKKVLDELNINHVFLVQMQKLIFSRAGSTVKIRSVLDLMMMCRGDSVSTVQTLAGGFCFIEHQLDMLYEQIMPQLNHINGILGKKHR